MSVSNGSKIIADAPDIDRMLMRIAHEILEKHPNKPLPSLVGIRTRGAHLAARLVEKIGAIAGVRPEAGILDINLYRDDLTRVAEQPVIRKTEIPFNLDDRTLVLVDDVLYTGRTVRAALAALIDLGRPKVIRLAALVDRGHRELPIKADFVGKNIPTQLNEIVHVKLKESDGRDEIIVEAH